MSNVQVNFQTLKPDKNRVETDISKGWWQWA
nr:MAG TPA: hypothetical protein [Caudoviricetes sp.]